MMCDQCADLKARIAWLESELDQRIEADALHALQKAIAKPHNRAGRPQTVQFIRTLYAAKGRTVTNLQLLDAIPATEVYDERNPCIVKVWANAARNAIGPDAIETVWGKGYRLTAAGISRVLAMLEPVEAAA